MTKAKSAERKENGPSIRKVSAEAMQHALQAAKLNESLRSIAAEIGVRENTLRSWLLRADDPLGYPKDADLYEKLRADLELAYAQWEKSLAATALAGARGGQPLPDPNKTKADPKLSHEMLSKHSRTRKHWAPQEHQIEVSAGAGGGIQIFLPRKKGDTTPDGRESY